MNKQAIIRQIKLFRTFAQINRAEPFPNIERAKAFVFAAKQLAQAARIYFPRTTRHLQTLENQ